VEKAVEKSAKGTPEIADNKKLYCKVLEKNWSNGFNYRKFETFIFQLGFEIIRKNY
jgi:hypothetical protein